MAARRLVEDFRRRASAFPTPDSYPLPTPAPGKRCIKRKPRSHGSSSIATTFWDRRATLHHAQLVEHLTAFDAQSGEAMALLQANGLSAAQGHAVVNRLIDQQAFMLSANDMFYASALLFMALVGVVWLAKAPARFT